MLVKISDFKKCLSRFATGVSIVTSRSSITNEFVGVTVSSLASLSLNPPLILFCLIKNSKSHEIFMNEKFFLANILTKNQVELSEKFSKHIDNRWNNVDIYLSEQSKLPIIKGSMTYIECMKYANYDGGDHTIFVGEVINLEILEDDDPLIHYKSNYHNLNLQNKDNN